MRISHILCFSQVSSLFDFWAIFNKSKIKPWIPLISRYSGLKKKILRHYVRRNDKLKVICYHKSSQRFVQNAENKKSSCTACNSKLLFPRFFSRFLTFHFLILLIVFDCIAWKWIISRASSFCAIFLVNARRETTNSKTSATINSVKDLCKK